MEAVYTTVLSVFVIIHGACAMSCPDFVTEVPHSYTAVHNHVCYLFVNNEVFWPTARDKCFELGGEMLSIEDQATMDFIKDQLNSKELRWDRKGVWLGARYRNSNWEWTNGRRVSYTNWASGEPSKLFGFLSVEDCAQMRKEDNWQWHDFPCGSLKFHYNYVCEFPLNKPGDSAGRVAPSASGQEDNGNTSILAIIIGLSAGLLLLMLVIFVLLHVHHRRARRKPETAVHYSNGAYNNSQRSTTVPEGPTPPIPNSRPPQPADDLYLIPKDVTGMYSEVNKPSGHLHTVSFPSKACSCTHVQTGASNSVCSSPGTSSELGACGGGDPEQDLKAPLMPNGTASGLASGGASDTPTIPPPPPCCTCSVNPGEYIDMNSLMMKGESTKPGKDEDKHTYSNVDDRDSGFENHYEVLP